jgi:hypothetical protein
MQKGMSALPPKADMCSALAHVCFGPEADMASHSLDHFVGKLLEMQWHVEAQRFRRLEIKNHLVFGWHLDR